MAASQLPVLLEREGRLSDGRHAVRYAGKGWSSVNWNRIKEVTEALSKVTNVTVEADKAHHKDAITFIFYTRPRVIHVEVDRYDVSTNPKKIVIRKVLHWYMDFILNEIGEINDDVERKS